MRSLVEWERRLVERLLHHAGKWEACRHQLDQPVNPWEDGQGISFAGLSLHEGEAILAEAQATTPAGIGVAALLFEGDGVRLSTLDFFVNGALDVSLDSLEWQLTPRRA